MNSNTINKILRTDPFVSPVFEGVFPSDKIPSTKDKLPSALIVNTHPHYKPGEHWVAFYTDPDGRVEYFDSYGNKPFVQSIKNFAGKDYLYSNREIQGPLSATCGQYTVYFLCHRCRGVPMQQIVSSFSCDKIENDALITEYINELYDVDTKTYDTEMLANQICTALGQK